MTAESQRKLYAAVFQEPQDGYVVNLVLERKHEHWILTSKELPGLFITDQDLFNVLESLRAAAFGLWEVISNPEKYNQEKTNAKD